MLLMKFMILVIMSDYLSFAIKGTVQLLAAWIYNLPLKGQAPRGYISMNWKKRKSTGRCAALP